jgi:F420-0:gamma-glutamyl ligase-like protein
MVTLSINTEYIDTTYTINLPNNFVNGIVVFNVEATCTTSFPDSTKRYSLFVYDELSNRLGSSSTYIVNETEIITASCIYRVNGNSTGVISIKNKSGIYSAHSSSAVNRIYGMYIPFG